MSHDRIAPLLVDHARGALDDEESAEIQSHLKDCAECRDTLETIGELARLAEFDDQALLGHVQAQHLVAFSEGRQTAAGQQWIASHISACAVCSEALEVLRSDTEKQTVQGDQPNDWWRFLRRTLLGPVPALAYLLALLIVTPLLLRDSPEPHTGPQAPDVLPAPVRLYADDSYRGGDPAAEEVVSLLIGEGQTTLHLQLVTDLERSDLLAEPDIELTIHQGDRLILNVPAPKAVDATGLAHLSLSVESLSFRELFRVQVRSRSIDSLPLYSAAFTLERK